MSKDSHLTENDATVRTKIEGWLVSAVIGLNLCPFAKSVYVKEQIRYVISRASTDNELLEELETELLLLADEDPQKTDTTLLIVPALFAEFFEFNDFLTRANRLLKRLRLVGELQIASFHPLYEFADRVPDDIENYTNRAPYPILHILREDSIERAVEAFPDAASIYERNQETLRKLGHEGWTALLNKPG